MLASERGRAMADLDPTGVRTIALAHTRLDDHEKRLIRSEVRQEELTRRLEKLENVPADIAEVKGDVKAILARLDGQNDTGRARSDGNGKLIESLRALVYLVVGGLITFALNSLR